MLHWIRPEPVAYAGARTAIALPGDKPVREPQARAVHARMLAHAATRRRAAVKSLADACRVDAAYWKALAPQGVTRAVALRAEPGFARLPG